MSTVLQGVFARGAAVLAIGLGLTLLLDARADAGDRTQAPKAVQGQSATNTPRKPEKRWHIYFTAANLWPKLNESESKINHLINHDLGGLFPRWKKPITFKNWRNEFKLWDFQVGGGHDINEKWTWYVGVGGVYGFQPNHQLLFPLGIPVKIHVDFERTVYFVTGGVDYYFDGRPSLPKDRQGKNSIWVRLRAAKPYFEGALGYVNLTARATVNADLFGVQKILHYPDTQHYNLFYYSPRIGVEVPVSRKDSLSFAVGSLLFTNHPREYDNISLYTVVRHRF